MLLETRLPRSFGICMTNQCWHDGVLNSHVGIFESPNLSKVVDVTKKDIKKEHLHIPWILLEEPELLLQEPEQKTKQIIPSLIKYSPRTHGIIKLERLGRT